MQGAIAKTADEVYQRRLTPEQQAIARGIFLRLTELGEGTPDTRRRVSLSELIPQDETAASVQAVLQDLGRCAAGDHLPGRGRGRARGADPRMARAAASGWRRTGRACGSIAG